MKEEYPYNLPIWRRKHREESPDKKNIVEINPAYEVSMGNPTYGNLIFSNGLNINLCNPSFIWSDNSKYLAVAQYSTNWLGGIGKQKLLIIDINKQQVWQLPKLAYYIQPETFKNEELTITLNPFENNDNQLENSKTRVKEFLIAGNGVNGSKRVVLGAFSGRIKNAAAGT